MPRKKSNDLKLTDLKKQSKSLDKLETYTLANEKDLHFYPVFKGTKIQDLLNEYQEKTLYTVEHDLKMNEQTNFQYILLLIIKHFTHLGKDIPDTFEGQIEALQWLIDNDVFDEIVNEVLDKKEIHKVFDKLTSYLANVQYLEKLQVDVKDKVQNLELENADLIKEAFGKFDPARNVKADTNETH